MLRVISYLVLLGLAGCSSRAPAPVAPVDYPNNAGSDWFCEMHPDGETWDCVRDRELARHPKPARIPEPKPAPEPLAEQLQPPLPSIQTKEPVPPSRPAPSRPTPPPQTIPVTTTSKAEAQNERLPKHVRLAYKPDKPVSIIELPSDLYAVQLIAMSNREALEAYVKDNQLRGMSAAHVEKDGEVFYILLLGIYPTAAIANEAAQNLAPPLDKLSPWIRRLGSLQQAMLRAEEIEDK